MIRRNFLKLPGLLFAPIYYEEPTTILLVGDSLAVGISRNLKKALAEHNTVLFTHAIGATNSKQWAIKGWLPAALKKWKPENVLVILGTNDSGIPASRKAFPDNAKRIVETCHKLGAETVIWSTPPKISIHPDFIFNGAKSCADVVIDYRSLKVKMAPKDTIHPSQEGYKVWADNIVNDLIKGFVI